MTDVELSRVVMKGRFMHDLKLGSTQTNWRWTNKSSNEYSTPLQRRERVD